MAKKITINDFNSILSDRIKKVEEGLPRQLAKCCEMIRSTALNDMAKTPRNNEVTYWSGKNGNIPHHPSLPGNPPAPDTGNLRASIHYTVHDKYAVVGTDVEYGKHLEFGTSKMAPRPWLKPSIEKNGDNIKKLLSEVLK